MGRCVGDGTPAQPPTGSSPMIDFRKQQDGAESLKQLASLGFKTDEQSGAAYDPQGRPVTYAYYAWLETPVDFSQERVSQSIWNAVLSEGYRLDESSCRLASPSGQPLMKLTMLFLRHNIDLQMQNISIESLKVKLSGLNAAAPVPDSVRRQMSEMQTAGVKLPPQILQALQRPGTTVGSLSRSVDAVYLDQTRFFDGQRSLSQLTSAAMPSKTPPGTPAGKPVQVISEEQRFSNTLTADLVAKFGQSVTGRELLSHFRGKDGALHLPLMLVLKTNQRPDEVGEYGAFFDPSHNTMVVNHWQIESGLLAILPDADKNRIRAGLSDPRVLRQYLEQHPKERAQLLGDIDEVFYHELVHAWQDRRDRLDIEMMNGNVPGYNPLAKEYEAHRLTYRYDFDKASRDPNGLMRSGYRTYALSMLKEDYDLFRDHISRLYMSSFAGSQELNDVAHIQAARESTARKLLGDGLYMRSIESLKMVGLWHGDEALKAARSDYAARESDFIHNALPEIRRQALAILPDYYEREGRWHWAELILDSLPDNFPGRDAALSRWSRGIEPELSLKPKNDTDLQDRLTDFKFYRGLVSVKKADWTPALHDAFYRDVHSDIASLLEKAKDDPTQRAALISIADSWVSVLPKNDPDRARVAAAKKRDFH
jgi:hypothetical protein